MKPARLLNEILFLGDAQMYEAPQLASEVAHRILECDYGLEIGEHSQLFTDLTEMVRASIEGEKLFGEPDNSDSGANSPFISIC
jgi:hypothetical protein